jgi:hypothetical protein
MIYLVQMNDTCCKFWYILLNFEVYPNLKSRVIFAISVWADELLRVGVGLDIRYNKQNVQKNWNVIAEAQNSELSAQVWENRLSEYC